MVIEHFYPNQLSQRRIRKNNCNSIVYVKIQSMIIPSIKSEKISIINENKN